MVNTKYRVFTRRNLIVVALLVSFNVGTIFGVCLAPSLLSVLSIDKARVVWKMQDFTYRLIFRRNGDDFVYPWYQ